MKKETFKGILIDYERRNSSVYGNPKYYLVFESKDGETLGGCTASDASCGYSCLNNKNKEKVVTYHETRTGNIIIDYITIVE